MKDIVFSFEKELHEVYLDIKTMNKLGYKETMIRNIKNAEQIKTILESQGYSVIIHNIIDLEIHW